MAKNMKRFLIFGVLLALGTALFAQTASDFEVALTDDGNGVVIKSYTGKVTSTFKIPATIEGLPVREIGEMAFIGEGTVSNSMGVMTVEVPFAVVLPQGLIKIEANAFAECALTSVTLPDSITEIGERAFANYEFPTRIGILKPPAPLLTSVTLPKGLTKVGSYAFSGNTALKTVVIPEGCSILGENMFERCTALTAITIPKSITVIPSNAFAWCTGLKTLVIPEGLTEIAGGNSSTGAFVGCTALTSVTLPSTITTIGGTAFRGCSALITVTIPDSVVTIDGGKDVYGEKTLLEWAFPECGKLNLATQARLRKITVINKAEQARKQREQAEREQEARIAEQQRQEQERAEQQRQERERIAAVLEERQRAQETASALSVRLRPIYNVAYRRDKPNEQQFTEFMAIYQDYIAAKTNYDSLQGKSGMLDLELRYREFEDHINMIIGFSGQEPERTV
jgi:hypothetical protein